jgi:cell wall-associated NlpC family hydrolase
MWIAAPVATLWTAPDAPRPVDAPALAAAADGRAWADALDTPARLALQGRVDTQALRGEPVTVDETDSGWARVVLLHQPSSLDPRGYPGWLPACQLTADPPPAADLPPRPAPDGPAILATARKSLGVGYLWGGRCRFGVDCSGLMSLAHYRHGIVIPRDAHDQAAAGVAVPVDAAREGDLLFFGDDRRTEAIHHVGMALGDGRMLHAPRTGRTVEIIELDTSPYADELCAARSYC